MPWMKFLVVGFFLPFKVDNAEIDTGSPDLSCMPGRYTGKVVATFQIPSCTRMMSAMGSAMEQACS